MSFSIPEDATVHFKAAFDIKGEKADLVLEPLRYIIRAYLEKKIKIRITDPKFFFGGLEYSDRATIYSTAADHGSDPRHPQHWVFQFSHKDSEFVHRWWSIEIGISKQDNETVRFVVESDSV